jgi:hypothetical protein
MMSSDKEKLDLLGRFVIESLYDRALDYYDRLVYGLWKSAKLIALHEQLTMLNAAQQELVKQCVKDAIDTGVHDFLFRLHEVADVVAADYKGHRIQLLVDGVDATAISDGLQGELYGKEGWIAKYSQYAPDDLG